MEPAELPDDSSRWPDDPFAVLRIARGAADTDIKRAYNRLLRRFKPEQFPDQFQKLRASYEACLTQSPWYRHETGTDDTEQPYILDAPGESPKDPIAEFWRAAVEGRPAEAYSGLVEAHRSYPERRDLPLRLYWLLAVHPELDSVRGRRDWLLAALQLAELSGPAVELYRRELEADPATMLGGAYDRLLATPASSGDLILLAGMRIAAAGRSADGSRLFDDLRLLLSRRAELGDVAWLGLLGQTFAWSAWGEWPPVSKFVAEELAALKYLELPQSYEFDRIDAIRELAGPWNFWANSPLRALLPILRVDCADSDEPDAADIEAAVAAIVEPFQLRLADLNRMAQDYGPDMLVRVARIFMNYLGPRDRADREEFPPDVIRAVGRRLGKWLALNQYGPNMHEVIGVLAAEGIEPGEFAAAHEGEGSIDARSYALRMKEDIVFRVGWLTLRIAWG